MMQGSHDLSSEVAGDRASSFFRGLPFSGLTLFRAVERRTDQLHHPNDQTL
jgi:hypothetical protein